MKTKPATNLAGLLHQSYPQVYRLSVALCGNAATASKIAQRVLRRGATLFKTWETDEDAARWFARFTVLNSRACIASNSKKDALLTVTTDPDAIAVIYALRQLPMQQREAFLLHHGEAMELRQMATAMDCSSAAAATHLTAAAKSLRILVPAGLTNFTSVLPDLLARLLPPPQKLDMQICRVLRKHRFRTILRYTVVWPAGLILLCAMAWEIYRFFKMIVI